MSAARLLAGHFVPDPAPRDALTGNSVISASGWFAALPSGTSDVYKIYGESVKARAHLQTLLREALHIVNTTLTAIESGAPGLIDR